MLYKYEVFWEQTSPKGTIKQILSFPDEYSVKNCLAFLLNRKDCDNIGINFNKNACVSDFNSSTITYT